MSLHSTMFLLIPNGAAEDMASVMTLHSTMFLLILFPYLCSHMGHISLHSTMFLLIHTWNNPWTFTICFFTFHYVSINTLAQASSKSNTNVFTFHYVSINTIKKIMRLYENLNFTFHYVSINTGGAWMIRRRLMPLHSTMFLLIRHIFLYRIGNILLYIPLCFY